MPVLVKGLTWQRHLVFSSFFRSHPRFEDRNCEEGRPAVHEDVYGFTKILHLPNEVMKRDSLGKSPLSLKLNLLPGPFMLLFQLFLSRSDVDMI